MRKLIFLLFVLTTNFIYSQKPSVDVIRWNQTDTQPSTPQEGWTYMDETNGQIFRYDGTDWEQITGVTTNTSELINDGEDGVNPFITASSIPDVVPRDSLIVQSPDSFGTLSSYWIGTEAQMDALILIDPDYFDNVLWFCTDCTETVEVDWGNINGTLSDQTDLQSAFDLKLNSSAYTAADLLSKLLTVDGPGSGVSADLFDDLNSLQFLRSDVATSKTDGNLSFLNQTRITFGSPSVAQLYENGSGTFYLILNSADFNIYDGFFTPRFTYGRTTGNFTATGTVTATSLIKSGGTSTQYLMADGSTKNEPYLKYVALLTQSGTSAPTATVLENTFGAALVPSRTGVGTYHLNLGGAFTLNKTVCFTTMGSPITSTSTTNEIRAYRQTGNNIIIQTTQDGVLVDGNLTTATIEIRVYP